MPQITRNLMLVLLSLLAFRDRAYAQDAGKGDPPFLGKVILCNTVRISDEFHRIEALDPNSLEREEVLVLDEESPIAVSISPDGTQIAISAFVRENDATTTKLFLVDSKRKIREIAEDATVIAWSPDATKLLIREGKDYEWSHTTVNLKSGERKRLPLPATDYVTDWSPSGSRLSVVAGNPEKIFEQRPGEFYSRRQMYLYSIQDSDIEEGSAQVPRTDPNDDCGKGAFSNDGRSLAYCRRTYDTGKPVETCEVLDLATGEHRTIVNFTALGVKPNVMPLWSKDSNRLLWQVSRMNADGLSFELWFLDADGSARRTIPAEKLGLEFFGVMDWK